MNQKDRKYIINHMVNYFNNPDIRFSLSYILINNTNIKDYSETFHILAYTLDLKKFENCIKETFNINLEV